MNTSIGKLFVICYARLYNIYIYNYNYNYNYSTIYHKQSSFSIDDMDIVISESYSSSDVSFVDITIN